MDHLKSIRSETNKGIHNPCSAAAQPYIAMLLIWIGLKMWGLRGVKNLNKDISAYVYMKRKTHWCLTSKRQERTQRRGETGTVTVSWGFKATVASGHAIL